MVNFFIGFVLRLLRSMLEVLSFSKHTITNTLNIYVKTNTGNTLAVGLDPKWDIKNVKEIVGPKLGLDPQDIRIIFAGKELHDSTTIEQCDLGQQSVLHVVKSQLSSKRTGRLEPLGEGSKPLNETLIDLQLSDGERSDISTVEEREAKRAHFYVYCASPCKSLKTGKLRVRCSSCLSGAFTVDRDPQNWDDVLQPHRITGYCETPDCVAVCDGLHFAEFVFKCSDHPTQGETDLAVPLYLIKSNVRDVPCLACTDISDPVLVFPCSSGHVTCLDCFRTYCSSQLRERQFWSHPEHGYTLPCPAGCPDSLITEVHHFKLLTEQQYAQYQRFGAEEFVLQAGGVLCPQPDCGMGILVDPDCKRVQCIGGCGFVFCRSCLQGYHIGECMSEEEQASADVAGASCQYNVDPSKVSQARWDEASKKTIKVMSKPCPKCRTPTERDGGCMHMICTRPQCGFHWCWVCQTAWTRECMGNHWFG